MIVVSQPEEVCSYTSLNTADVTSDIDDDDDESRPCTEAQEYNLILSSLMKQSRTADNDDDSDSDCEDRQMKLKKSVRAEGRKLFLIFNCSIFGFHFMHDHRRRSWGAAALPLRDGSNIFGGQKLKFGQSPI